MTFGEKLQRLRRENGLSQLQLAEKLNVSRQAISKWETGAVPDMDNALKISRFFGCSLDYLMNSEADDEGVKIKPSAGAVCKKKQYFADNGRNCRGAGRRRDFDNLLILNYAAKRKIKNKRPRKAVFFMYLPISAA